MSTTQSARGQAARWKIPFRSSAVFLHNPLRSLINILEWIAGNDAANRGLGTLTSLISVIAVVIAVVQYYASASERELQTELSIWDDLTNNTGQKDAIELLAMHGVSMNSIRLSGADLSKVHIARANLSYSDIEESNLSNADLTGVELAGATIRNDDFSWANFTGADLNNLNLNNSAHSDNFSGAIMPAGVDLGALEAIACVGRTKTGAIIWPVQNGQALSWPVDAQGRPQMCMPPKAWQASCASAWCNPEMVKKHWYDFGFLLAPLTSGAAAAFAATTSPTDSYPAPVTNHPASAPTRKPPPPTATRQTNQATSPPI